MVRMEIRSGPPVFYKSTGPKLNLCSSMVGTSEHRFKEYIVDGVRDSLGVERGGGCRDTGYVHCKEVTGSAFIQRTTILTP